MKSFLCALVVLLCTSSTMAETIRVNPSQVKKLQVVLNKLQSGDTVIFERGTYNTDRCLELNGSSDITVMAEGKAEIVLSNLDEAVLSVTNCQRIHIKGLRARHQRPNKEYACEGAVIRVDGSQHVAVSDCELDGCGAAGVYAMSTQDLVVFNNTIFNNSYAAVWVYDSSGIVHGNRMFKNAADLVTGGTCDLTLTGNQIKDNVGNDYSGSDFSREVMQKR